MFLLFVFEDWDHCFQLIGSLVDLRQFIFEIGDMSLPGIFGHAIALHFSDVPCALFRWRRDLGPPPNVRRLRPRPALTTEKRLPAASTIRTRGRYCCDLRGETS